MIYGNNATLFTALESIALSPFTFHLTGSRFFGTERPDSDYDFFVKQQTGLVDWLRNNGFAKDYQSYEGDPVIVEVWGRDNVHVQIVTNVVAKQYIQTNMRPLMIAAKLNKVQAQMFWRIATRLYKTKILLDKPS